MAKYFAGEVAREVTNKAIEITGSHGCYRDQAYEMLLRDAKALLVAGVSSEVMKNVIADVEIGR
jgi:alkylation response protein AidB-like acyl-CoA dehydrogenase